MNLAEVKARTRRQALAKRNDTLKTFTPGKAARHLIEELAQYTGKVLSGYLPIHSEISPLPAMSAHHGPVCVPVVEGNGLPLEFREWTDGCPLEDGPFGTSTPSTGAWLEPDILIVPLAAFDRRGFRLGYGGGFYDRTLEKMRANRPIAAIGYAWSLQELDEIPTEPTDQKLDVLITETEIIRIE